MSAYARAARALGAEVSGSDAARTPYCERLRGRRRAAGAASATAPRTCPPGEGVELVYSSARRRRRTSSAPRRASAACAERPRAELLAELTALRRTIAVAGTHGKTTTASMLVHALRGAGLEPGWLVGGPVGGGLANAELGRAASGSSSRPTSRTARCSSLERRDRAADERRARPPRDVRARWPSCARRFREFLAGPREAVVWDRPELLELRDGRAVWPYDARASSTLDARAGRASRGDGARGARWRCRARTTRSTPPARCEAARWRAPTPSGGDRRRWRGFARRRAALSAARRERRRARACTTTTPTTRPRSPRRSRPRARSRTSAWSPSSSRTCTRAPRCSRASSGARWRSPTSSPCSTSTRRASAPRIIPGVSGLLIAEAAADAAAGRPVYWLPTLRRRRARAARAAGRGRLCVVMGAGDVDELGRELVGA